MPADSELIYRALVTRIQHLEADLEHEIERRCEAEGAMGLVVSFLFPDMNSRHQDEVSGAAVVEELKRRGLGNGRSVPE